MSVSSTTMDAESTIADETPHAESETEKTSVFHTRPIWHMASEVRQMTDRGQEGGERPKKLGVTWRNLTVKGVGSDATFNENVLSQLSPFNKNGKGAQLKTIIEGSYGFVKPREMLLVLGRPGAGCTTFPPAIRRNIPYRAYEVGRRFYQGCQQGKRVSILEFLATRASVFCWDNSTRGLDASTALEWIKAIRAMTNILGLSTIVTLYQAGNGIHEHFDKILVLDEGKQIFYGPQKDAVPFMEDLGFMMDPGSHRADFLTGVTVPTERLIAPGCEDNYATSEEAAANTAVFKEMVSREKHWSVPETSSITVDFFTQVKVAVIRQYQLMWGYKPTLLMKQGATVIHALLGGSLFYSAPDNSVGLFLKGGALFFSVLYNALIARSEVTDSFADLF
ncbi:hypothetical protein ETB97_005293 [Aspergillus alliaceus]|uniref:ABC transporter domain-containing protein n=1 Tax=Petromyces alliaceus TaxID=209559 RepID=A0A8H6E386_PETAA|nr:hypothetical protein ETB97_005293 [Aspergillus burnettii]